MLNQGVIVPSNSPWASPVILAPEEDGNLPFGDEYRKLNRLTIPDAYPTPRIGATLDVLREATCFLTLDLRTGYW